MVFATLCGERVVVAAPPIASNAKAAYLEGVRHYQAGRYAEAAASFERAYALKGQPLILFNIGQCHRKLGEFPAAVEAYRRYLILAPATESPDTLAEARRYVAEIEAAAATERERQAQLERERRDHERQAQAERERQDRERQLQAERERQDHEAQAERERQARDRQAQAERERQDRERQAERERQTQLQRATAAAVVVPADPAPGLQLHQAPARPRRSVARSPWLWTGVAVVAVGLGVGLGVGLTRPSGPDTSLGILNPSYATR